jgi:hypothetical protein
MDRIRNPVDPVKRNAFGLDAGGCTGSEAGSVLKHKGPTWTVAVRLLEQVGRFYVWPTPLQECDQGSGQPVLPRRLTVIRTFFWRGTNL